MWGEGHSEVNRKIITRYPPPPLRLDYRREEIYPNSYHIFTLTHGAEPFLRSFQLCSHSRTFQRFIEPEGSLPHSQESSTQIDSIHTIPSYPSKIHFNIVHPSHHILGLQIGGLSWDYVATINNISTVLCQMYRVIINHCRRFRGP
jgi:hypothetical protein